MILCIYTSGMHASKIMTKMEYIMYTVATEKKKIPTYAKDDAMTNTMPLAART